MSKWALVTGAAKRIGRAIALDLADGGWDIIVHYNQSAKEAERTAKEIEAKGRKAHLAKADFADKRASLEYIPSLAEKLGHLTALVNNASIFEPDSSQPGGGDQRSINFEAPRILCEAFRQQLAKDGHGVIVNILDASAHTTGFIVYNSSKKALRALTLEMAYRYAPSIRVNGVAPGSVLPNSRQTIEHFKRSVENTLLKTEITPEAIASSVRFLLDNHAMTGEILHVDGGVRLVNTPAMYRA